VLKAQMLPETSAGRALLDEVRTVESGASTDSVLVMSVSDEDRLNIHDLYGTPSERFVPAPNGVDLPSVPFTPMSVRRGNRERWLASLRARGSGTQLTSLAAFVGSWHLPNNEAAQVILTIAEDLPHVGFLLVGSHVGTLRRTAVPPNVFLLGEISDAAKIAVLSTVDVALAPLMTGSGTNLKVVEYLAAGVPVVSTIVGMRGLNVPRDCIRAADIEVFGEAIRRELAEADAAEERTVRARIAVERLYDWAAIARRIAPRLLESLGCVDPDLAEVTAPSR
jgi:glycosyltransferase involved in cell wall biosynthesis